MATVSGRRTADARSGGKIVRNRRVPASSRTPYARPENLPERAPIEDHENPNWLSGLIYPAKMIASGAGKLLSFFGDSSPSSSDAESSENDDEEEDVETDDLFQHDDQSDKKVLSSSSKSDKKCAIEQLMMQETFSRAEGNELIELIKSRVVDANGYTDESAANMRTTAIMEARKWLQQKRSGSKKKMENGLDVTNVATPSQVSRNEKGSPVDMAKSYMQSRPAWASPTLNHSEFGSPSRLGILHFKEETPSSTLCSSEMKRSYLSSGSWNILEEIRRVRSKASEELLAGTPLTKTRLSSFSPESIPPQHSLMDVEREDARNDRPENGLLDASTCLPSRVIQDGDAVQSLEPRECRQDAEEKSNKDDKVNDLERITAENGFPSAFHSLHAGQDATLNPSPSKEENGYAVGSTQAGPDVHMEDPHANPAEDLVIGSQNSSSVEPEEPSQELSQPVKEQTLMTKAKDPQVQRGRKSRGGYTRRGRARGK